MLERIGHLVIIDHGRVVKRTFESKREGGGGGGGGGGGIRRRRRRRRRM
jgi:hypothetical protein